MYADGHRIVYFKDMGMRMANITLEEMKSYWDTRFKEPVFPKNELDEKEAIFNKEKMIAFALGKPSEAFGEAYQPFDKGRFIARLPNPPYLFLDRITKIEPPPWVLKPDGWIESEYDIPNDPWYFRANLTDHMPLSILLEIGLQPCGWLAAYMGSALKSPKGLRFRNLGGEAVLHGMAHPSENKLITRVRLKKATEAKDMIIEHFDFQVMNPKGLLYEGKTYFGFFTKESLSQQEGIRNIDENMAERHQSNTTSELLDDYPPLTPDDLRTHSSSQLTMPAKAIRMIDRIDIYQPNGGRNALGYILGSKRVDRDEWFFNSHFYQDPVCPGSLGIESFIQLLRFMALKRWPHLLTGYKFDLKVQTPHEWVYRGQIVPGNHKIEVDATVTEIIDVPHPSIVADGFLRVDGLYIYSMKNFGIELTPV
jgi:3-hydroxymyristoyl/3-hydroxydecanoyl-(acyl carrier protein) dehydratase